MIIGMAFDPDPKTRTGTNPKIQVGVRIRVLVHAKVLVGSFFLDLRVSVRVRVLTWDPIGYPKQRRTYMESRDVS